MRNPLRDLRHAKYGPENAERKPLAGTGWRELKQHAANLREAIGAKPLLLGLSVWYRSGVMVGSSIEIAAAPDASKEGIPQWHLCISAKHRRASDDECRRALVCFGIVGAEEDNQHPRMMERNFWMPVEPARRRAP